MAEALESRTYFSPIAFTKPVLYPTGTNPSDLVAVDLTGNGRDDIVTSDFSSSTISVLRGNGDGSLQTPVFYPVGNSPEAVATGDFNGDGVPDIVTANEGANTISVLVGNGDGTFQPQVTYATGIRPEAVAVADLTGNGHLDIVTADQGSNDVSVFMNNGDGTFAPAVSYFAGLEPDGLAVGDLNGDSRPDIVTVNPIYSNLHVLLNQGDGTFKVFGTYNTGSTARSVTLADMNSDGRPDIITSNLHGTSVSLLLNIGGGTFAANQDYGTGAFPFSIVVADINGDGRPDILTANNFDNSVGVLARNGMGGFYPELSYHGGDAPVAVVVADLNGDGRPDLISVDFNSSVIAVDLNETKFTPLIPTTITLTPQVNPVETNQPQILTVQVTPTTPGKVVPIGVVQIFDGDYVVGNAHINAAGIARVRVMLPAGDRVLSAHYSGDSTYAASFSTPFVEQSIPASAVTPFVAATAVTPHLPTTIVPGDRGSVTVSITNQAAGTAAGIVSATLYASSDGQLDSTAFPISSATNIPVNLIGGQSRTVNITATFSANGFEPGSYTILAALTPVQGLSSGQVNSGTMASAAAVQTALAFGAVGSHAQYALTRAENGSLVTFNLTGKGTGVITENSDGSVYVLLTSTNAASDLTITTKAGLGNSRVTLSGLSANGPIGNINAPTTTLTGTLSILNAAGNILGVRALTLAGVTNGSMKFGGTTVPRLSLGIVNGLNLFSYQPIRSLAVTSWSNTTADQITAPWIATLTSTGNFGANLTVSGAGAPRFQAVQSAVIGGSLDDSTWVIGSNIGLLQVGNIAAGWSGSDNTIVSRFIDTGDFAGQFAAINFGSVVIDGNVTGADILAGAQFGADGRLSGNNDFFGVGSIRSFTVNGNVTGSVIAAGLAPLGDDLLGSDTTLQKRAAIRSVVVGGSVDSTTKIVAATLPAQASIDGAKVPTESDGRFNLPG